MDRGKIIREILIDDIHCFLIHIRRSLFTFQNGKIELHFEADKVAITFRWLGIQIRYMLVL